MLQQAVGLVDLNMATLVIAGKTRVVLTFAGPNIVGGSLADGDYVLTIDSTKVHDNTSGLLDGDGNGLSGGERAADVFFRLFGDSDGDGDVDAADRTAFHAAMPSHQEDATYVWYFDYDADGSILGRDNSQFMQRFQH